MCKVYKYSELYSTDFMSYFDNKKEVISDIELQSDEYSIDIDKIIAELGIEVIETYFDSHSGKYDADTKKCMLIFWNRYSVNDLLSLMN
ncbi:hypothetical protein [Streptococcus sp. 2001]|uniref:hypothetical protein n=1 Tax=Streptococcus sp. 2001 TaxID=2582689 RepID=UPI001F04ED4C|nr:hypothetical protein [Streptococcus sp. 2001]